jgi:GNAT superfamily N-acetyltransferase
MSYALRLACAEDIGALRTLIPLSARQLQAHYYSPAQIEAALGPVFTVDSRLIADQTYFVAEAGATIAGCGGWSKRETLFGSAEGPHAEGSRELDPAREPARIRAFFVHPEWARQGIGRALMRACEDAAFAAGFRSMELVATLAGEALYAAFAYRATQRYAIDLPGGLTMNVVRMHKPLAPA